MRMSATAGMAMEAWRTELGDLTHAGPVRVVGMGP